MRKVPDWTGQERIIALHRAIAAKLLANPALLEQVRENVERQAPYAKRPAPYMDAWRAILKLEAAEIARLLVEDSERMRALRQCTPFGGVLTPQERMGIE